MFLLKLALRPWRLAPFSQFFAALAVGFLVFMIGFLFWLDRGLKPVVIRMQNEQVITAYLESAVEAQDEQKVVDSIRTVVGAKAEVRLVGPNQFVEDVKGHYPELGREIEDLAGDMHTVVPRYVSVAGVFGSAMLDKVKAVQGIESAESSRDRYRHIVGAFKAIRWVAKLLAAGLCLALFTGLLHLSRINSYLHQDAIALMKLWGAGATQQRAPAVLSALSIGMLGGAMTLVGWAAAGRWIGAQVLALSPMLREIALPSLPMGMMLFAVATVVGLMAGMFCGVSGAQGARG